MDNKKYERVLSDRETNRVLKKYYDKLMPTEQKNVLRSQIDMLKRGTSERSKNRAKVGTVSALEILYKLGKFLNTVE